MTIMGGPKRANHCGVHQERSFDITEQELETHNEDDEDADEEWQANRTTEEAYNKFSEYDSSDDESESD